MLNSHLDSLTILRDDPFPE